MFGAGIVVGAIAASFFMGIRSGDPDSIGRGIEHMISASKSRSTSQVPLPPKKLRPALSTSYDFYGILPEIEQIIPEKVDLNTTLSASAPLEKNEKVTEPVPRKSEKPASLYMLQAGSFAKMEDADRLKARLALVGLESRIQKVSIQGRGDFFRVRLGPFENTDAVEVTNRKLTKLGIKPLRLLISQG